MLRCGGNLQLFEKSAFLTQNNVVLRFFACQYSLILMTLFFRLIAPHRGSTTIFRPGNLWPEHSKIAISSGLPGAAFRAGGLLR
jgi:hypothetical protein